MSTVNHSDFYLHILRNPWGNSEDQVRAARLWAGDRIEELEKDLAQYETVIIPSWKLEEEMWREDEANAVEFRRVLAEELDKRDADIARLKAWLRDYQPRPADEVKS